MKILHQTVRKTTLFYILNVVLSRKSLVSFAAVFSVAVTQRWGGALRDETKNDCEGD